MNFVVLAIISILVLSVATPQAFAIVGVIDTINVGDNPGEVKVNPDTETIYVSNVGDNTVSVIDGSDNSIDTTINVGDGPFGVAVNPTTDTIYVTILFDDTVTVYFNSGKGKFINRIGV